LDELGLAAACHNFCRELQSRTKLAVKCTISPSDLRLPPAVELGLFRIVQEALNNVHKHAHARSVRVRLTSSGDSIRLKIQDDGRGIKLKPPGASGGKRHGIGLTNMQERAGSLGGTCVVSSVPNQGTTISVCVPASKEGSKGTTD
jgi:two-component system sensor histidine kinase DegS